MFRIALLLQLFFAFSVSLFLKNTMSRVIFWKIERGITFTTSRGKTVTEMEAFWWILYKVLLLLLLLFLIATLYPSPVIKSVNNDRISVYRQKNCFFQYQYHMDWCFTGFIVSVFSIMQNIFRSFLWLKIRDFWSYGVELLLPTAYTKRKSVVKNHTVRVQVFFMLKLLWN